MRSLIFIVACLFILSCSNDNCTPAGFLNTITDNKTIAITYDTLRQQNFYKVEDGEKVVFSYGHYGSYCEGMRDGYSSELLIFEIPNTDNNFEIRDSAIVAANCYYYLRGSWANAQLPVTDGLIKGKKLAENIWEVTVNVNAINQSNQNTKRIEFTKVFQK